MRFLGEFYIQSSTFKTLAEVITWEAWWGALAEPVPSHANPTHSSASRTLVSTRSPVSPPQPPYSYVLGRYPLLYPSAFKKLGMGVVASCVCETTSNSIDSWYFTSLLYDIVEKKRNVSTEWNFRIDLISATFQSNGNKRRKTTQIARVYSCDVALHTFLTYTIMYSGWGPYTPFFLKLASQFNTAVCSVLNPLCTN